MLEPISCSLTRTFKIILIVMSVSLFQVQAGLEDLDWQSLASKLSSSGALLDVSPAKFIDECTSYFADPPADGLSNHDLVAKPSGLCMNILVNGYEQCGPVDTKNPAEFLKINYGPPSELEETLFDPKNDRFNLPFKVVQPSNAGDIVAAVTFAAENGVELSVKNSGHHYSGASTKKDSILIHTPSLPKYAGSSIEECTLEDGDISADLSNQACKLALARNCPATIRVGGGENWGETYVAVRAFNKNAGVYKYHPVGGAAATVTPMGWTWQGGLAATQMGRELGFGVDQVLQIEMVLPDGTHVKFGPTEWEDADGYRYPKTTKVSGLCNSKPFAEDESKYLWEACTKDINFDDLWFAVRGGGGGTWGIVVSTHLQLHEYPGTFTQIGPDLNFEGLPCDRTTDLECEMAVNGLTSFSIRFFLELMLDPDLVTGVTQEQARKCAKPASGVFYCYGNSGEAVLSAWTTRVNEKRPFLVEELGMPEALVDWAAANFTIAYSTDEDYVSTILYPEGHRLEGKGIDRPPPSWNSSVAGTVNIILPLWLARASIEGLSSMLDYSTFISTMYFAHSPFNTDDQASSLSQAHRDGAVMIFQDESTPYYEFLFGGMDFDGDFPGFLGSNHLPPDSAGPIKSNWTKPCPIDWTWEERAEKCFSPQEAVYGTQRLKRLEDIKAKIDPKGLFNCYTCINTPPRDDDSDDDKSADNAHVIHNVAVLGSIIMTLLLTI